MLILNYSEEIIAEAMEQPSADLYLRDALDDLRRTRQSLDRLFLLATTIEDEQSDMTNVEKHVIWLERLLHT